MNKQLKCKESSCNGDIIKIINYSNYYIYDEELQGFKLEHVEPIDTWFRCKECCAEYNDSEIMEMLV